MTDIGHNENGGLTEAEQKALLFHHVNIIRAIRAEQKLLNEKLSNARQLAKADGFKLGDDVDFMIRLLETEDQSIVAGALKKQIQMAKWFGLPEFTQSDLFADNDANRVPADDQAKAEGERDGLAGTGPENPYSKGTTQHDAYEQAWHDAQNTMKAELQSAMEKKNLQKAEEAKAKGIAPIDQSDLEKDDAFDGGDNDDSEGEEEHFDNAA